MNRRQDSHSIPINFYYFSSDFFSAPYIFFRISFSLKRNIPHDNISNLFIRFYHNFCFLFFIFLSLVNVQVEFYMMFHAKCAVIIVLENIMASLHVMDALVSLNVLYEDPEIMCAKQKPKEIALLIKPIEINAEHVV